MADVFISYSRKDKEFVQRLDEALRERGREAWVDWEGIQPAEEFMQAIYGAIDGTDTFLFVLSPDSVSSLICGKEIAHAVAQKKRIIPVIARDVNSADVPEAVAKLNWIFCRDSDNFAEATATLVRALDTDLDWVRAHTRLLTRASEWEAKGRNNSFVLRGSDLRDAEQWLTAAGAETERQPTQLQTTYILSSRKAEGRRQRITLGAVSFGAAVAIVLAVLAMFARQDAVQQRNIAQERQAEAELQSRIALSRQLAAQAQGMARYQPKLIARAGLLAIEAAQIHPSLDTDQALRAVLDLLPHSLFSLPCKPSVKDIAFSADGDSLLIADGDYVLRRWDLLKREETWRMPLDEETEVLGISPDLATVALWRENSLFIRRLKDGRDIRLEIKNEMGEPDEVVFNKDSSFCIARSHVRSHLYDLATGKLVVEGRWWGAFDDAGRVVGCSDTGNGVVVTLAKSGEVLAKIPGLAQGVMPGARQFSDDDYTGLHSASLSSNARFVTVWDGQQVRAYEVGSQRLLGAVTNDLDVLEAWVDDRGRFLVVRGERGMQTRIWSLSPLKEFARFSDFNGRRVRFSPDGSCFATTRGPSELVHLWRTTGGEEVAIIKPAHEFEAGSTFCELDPSGEFVLMPGSADEAWVCAVQGGSRLATLPHRGVERVAISRRNELLVTAGGEDGVLLWRLQRSEGKITGASAPIGLKEPGTISSMCLTADGAQLFTTHPEDTQAIRIWNTANGEPIGGIPFEHGAESIACSADGMLIAVSIGNSEIQIIALPDKQIVRKIFHGQHSSSVSLSADGRYLATSAWRDVDFQARLWEVSTGQQIASATHDQQVARIFFSPGDRSLVTADIDGTAHLWAIDFSPEGKPAGTTEVGRIQTPGMEWITANARYLASVGDGAIRIWRLQSEDLAEQVRSGTLRNLTRLEWQTYMGQTPYRRTCPNLPEEP